MTHGLSAYFIQQNGDRDEPLFLPDLDEDLQFEAALCGGVGGMLGTAMKLKKGATKAIRWVPGHDHVGFCDRLRGIAAGAVFADVLGVKLLVEWNPCEPCPVDFLQVFEESQYFLTRWDEGDFDVLEDWDFAINEMPLAFGKKVSQRGLVKAEGILLSDDEILERWERILRSLKPVASVTAKIEAIRGRANPDRMLGVHLRRTDALFHQCRDINPENVGAHDAGLWSRIIGAVEEGEFDEIYLASDDREYFEKWKAKLARLPVKVHCNEAAWGEGMRQTPLDDLLVDLYLLSSCRKVFGSVWSSVFFVGGALGGDFEIIEPLEDLGEKKGEESKEGSLAPQGVMRTSSTAETGLTAITVSVNYRDLLAWILENRRFFDEWIIVTSPDDRETQELCEKEGLRCLVTDVFYRGGDSFNKARGLNLALGEVKEGNWVVSLDSDLLLPEGFRERLDAEELDQDCLYGLSGRCLCRNPETLELLKVSEAWAALAVEEPPWVLGYFQLFHPDNRFAWRFDEMVSTNASAYDDQFAKDFGPENWRFLPMTGVHLGEIDVNWEGREVKDSKAVEVVDWEEEVTRDEFRAVLDDLLGPQKEGARILHVMGEGNSLDDEIGGLEGGEKVDRWGGIHSERLDDELKEEGEYDLIVLSAAVRGEEFHPLFEEILPLLKKGGGVVAPFFDASKWPEWTATLSLRLGVPERVREDGWCLIRPEAWSEEDLGNEEGVVLLPITSDFVSKTPMALHSVRKNWRGRIVLVVSDELPGPWDRIAATYQAKLMKVGLPRAAEWDDQWAREVERFSLVTVKGLLGLVGERVLVWHPEAICLRSPSRVFEELGEGEIYFLYGGAQEAVGGKTERISQCVVQGKEEGLRGCEGRLAAGLRIASSQLASRGAEKRETLFEILRHRVERLVGPRFFESVREFGMEEEVGDDLVGIIFPDGLESSDKLVCEHWAEVEDEVQRSFACEIPTSPGTSVALLVEEDSLAALYFNFRLWKLSEAVPVHIFYRGVPREDFFFLEEREELYLHDLEASEAPEEDWISQAVIECGSDKLAIVSPRWKPRPGATLQWPVGWRDFRICGSHSEVGMSFEEFAKIERWADGVVGGPGLFDGGAKRWAGALTELRFNCLNGDFLLADVKFLGGVELDGLGADPFFVIWYLAMRQDERIREGSLEKLGWMMADETPGLCEVDEVGGGFDFDDPGMEGKVGLITLSNEGYSDYTLNCFRSLQRLGGRGRELGGKLVCYSVGRACHERMVAEGIRSVLLEDEEHSGFQIFRQGGWAGVVKHKFEAISRELLKNEFVLFTDGDIVFESTDFVDDCLVRMIREDAELLVQNDSCSGRDDDHSVLCSGFMMIRSTKNTREAFSMKRILPVVDEDFCDQLYLNEVIRNSVRTSVLPLADYPNGRYFQRFGKGSQAKLYHFNYLVGHQKKAVMRESGKWHLEA